MIPESFNIYALIIILGGWIFTVCLHEFSHALVGYLGGDKSIKKKGYLTFNPLRYLHPVFSIAIPVVFLLIFGIGLPGAAITMHRDRMRSKMWHFMASLAGPLASIILLVLMLIPFWMGVADPNGNKVVWSAYASLCYLQVIATFINLLPLPPMDGFSAISSFLPARLLRHIRGAVIYALFLALVVVLIYVPVVRDNFWGAVNACSSKIGIPLNLAYDGLYMIRLNLIKI
jgi:Zn-dependent protease